MGSGRLLDRPDGPFILFGGSFDPIHTGHIAIARYAVEALHLSYVYFIPAGRVPLRAEQPRARAQERLDMCTLALSAFPEGRILTHELFTDKASYLSDTVRLLRRHWGVAGKMSVLIGDDLLAEFPRWHSVVKLAQWVRAVVVRRQAADGAVQNLIDIGMEYQYLSNRIFPVSSTAVRDTIAARDDASGLLAPPVLEYIRENNLYGINNT